MTAEPNPDTTTLLDAARDWYNAGYAIIPTHEDGGKRPFTNWRDYQTQRPTWPQVETWLNTGKYTGIGILTGAASGHVEMLELEGPMTQAVQRLNTVIQQANQYAEINLPELFAKVARGCVEQSAGGGLHLFIRITDGPALGNTKLAYTLTDTGRKIIAETRGEGGFVVVAPTTGRNGHEPGTSYLFINGGHPANTVTVTAEERDLLHTVITLALNEDTTHTPQPTHDPVQEPVHATRQPTDTNSTFDDFRNRVTWQEILTPHGWTHHHHDTDRDYWTRPGKKPIDGASASTIEDGPFYNFSGNANLPEETGLSKAHVYAHLNHNGDLSAAAKDLNQQGYGPQATVTVLPPWTPAEGATDEEVNTARANYIRDNFPTLNWHDLWEDQTEEEWIVEPLLAARRLVALYSAPKVGKSLLMLEMAAAIACGRPMFGYQPAKPTRTLYVDFENDPRGDIRRRLQDMDYTPNDLNNLCYLSFPTMKTLDSEAGSLELLAAADEYNCDVIVIDTVSRAIGGDENENDTWLNFYRHTGLKLKQAGKALIRLDHSGKDETKGQRGGSAKSGDVDAVWRMKRRDKDEDLFELECEANRFPIPEKRFSIRRLQNPLRHEVDGNPLKTLQDKLLDKLTAANMPRNREWTVAEARQATKNHNISYSNDTFNKALWDRYVNTPTTWQPTQISTQHSA